MALAVVVGGTISGVGMFNALMLSYTRIPYALARERLLPQEFTRVTRSGVPWLSVLLCGVAWALALKLPFAKLISLDLVLYGASLVLEFVALVVLRARRPGMVRPFRVPGGMAGAVAVGVGPALLIAYAMWAARGEQVMGISALLFAVIVAGCGPIIYAIARIIQQRGRPA
jgi:amino acid transporter